MSCSCFAASSLALFRAAGDRCGAGSLADAATVEGADAAENPPGECGGVEPVGTAVTRVATRCLRKTDEGFAAERLRR